MSYKILAINPGSTSTKIAIYEDERPLWVPTLHHSHEEISRFEKALDQLEWRRGLIMKAIEENGFNIHDLSAVIGRGGLIKPVPGGVYEVNARMQDDLIHAEKKHVCNLGGLLAAEIAETAGVKAYIADPPVVDEMCDEARISGLPSCPRKSIFHALNHKATARLHCKRNGLCYEEVNLIVVHMGGGISVAAHRKGQVIDVNNALDGDGSFAPDRAGSLPSCSLIRACFSGKFSSADEMIRFISSKGGLVAYLGTNSVIEIRSRIEQGDTQAKKLLDAMCYNVSKQIGAAAAALCGKVDAILLTGGIAHCEPVVDYIRDHCAFIAPLSVYPGENELESLALNALAVLRKEREASVYL